MKALLLAPMKALLFAGAAVAALAAAATATPAQALPTITAGDTMNIAGNATFTSTEVTFNPTASLLTGTGDYVPLGTCTSCVLVNTPLDFAPFTNISNLFTASNNGLIATVSLTSQVDPPSFVGGDLSLNDTAILTLTGFAPTAGTLELTINQASGIASGSFSATAQGTSVPEPTSLAILGAGVLGLGALRRRTH